MNVIKEKRIAKGISVEEMAILFDLTCSEYEKYENNLSIMKWDLYTIIPVSYTHLDVYKRQGNFIVDQDGNVTIKKGAFNIAGNFIVNNDGSLTAKKGEFTGSINANDGNIGGWNIDSNGLYNGTVKIKNSGITNIYTWADVYMVRMIVSNVVTADADMISHYDFNGDGKITSADYVILKNRLKAM